MIGVSLWAANRIKNNGSLFKFAFQRYTNDHFSNANSALAALINGLSLLFQKITSFIRLGIVLEIGYVILNVLLILLIG